MFRAGKDYFLFCEVGKSGQDQIKEEALFKLGLKLRSNLDDRY